MSNNFNYIYVDKFYIVFMSSFDDKNTENLRTIAKGAADEDDDGFSFDPKSIN